MPSLNVITPITGYQRSFTGADANTDQKAISANEVHNDNPLNTISNDKVGTTSEKVARKSIKYLWHKFTNYVHELFHKNNIEEKTEITYDYEA